jgi:hypothetical protein
MLSAVLLVFFVLLLVGFVGFICWDDYRNAKSLKMGYDETKRLVAARQINADQITEQLLSAARDLDDRDRGILGASGFSGFSGISRGISEGTMGWSGTSGVSGFAPPQGSSFSPGNGTRLVHAARSSSWWCGTEESTY